MLRNHVVIGVIDLIDRVIPKLNSTMSEHEVEHDLLLIDVS